MEHKKYTILDEQLKDSEVYAHMNFEDLRGYISGKTTNEIIEIEKSIRKCTCGGDIELHEYECMGDGSYEIKCKICGKSIERSQYDCDITKWDDVLNFCIRDWNNGLVTKDIEEMNRKERLRRELKKDSLVWNKIYANNLVNNPIDGEYALLFKKNEDDEIDCLKWSIMYQMKEIAPLTVSGEIESYNLFMQRYFDVQGELRYPEPTTETSFETNGNTLYGLGVNDVGDFVRNYKTLEDAVAGALERCGFYGYDNDTIIKQ